MTEDHSELNLCPNCGKENLPMATRCVHCGSEMEALFTIFGQSPAPDEESEDSLPDLIENIRNDPSLQVPAELEPTPESQPGDSAGKSASDAEQPPDWLSKVRERAQGEEDAIGDLVSGTLAMDAARSEEVSAGVEGEFNAWISRIRGKNQEQYSARVRQLANEAEDSDEVPEWLQRIRALRPHAEEDITHEVKTGPSYEDELPREWTDEALAELRRQALAEDSVPETEPLLTASTAPEEGELSAEHASNETSQIIQEEHELTEDDFHNIPDDEDETLQPIPEEDQTPSTEVEQNFVAEVAALEVLETEEIAAPEVEPELQVAENPEEPRQDTPEEPGIDVDEVLAEDTPAETGTNELPEPNEPEAAATEEEAKLAPEEPEEPEEIETPPDSGAVPPDLLLLRDQQARASLLASLIEQEGRVTAGKQAVRKPSGRGGRLAVALLLLIGLIVSMLIGPDTLPVDAPKSVPAVALSDQIQTLTDNDQVLVVLDYQAATSRELEALAAPLLEQLQSQGTKLTFMTTQPSGLFLAQSLLEQAGLPGETQVEYLPGSYLNLIGWAVNSAISATGDDLLQGKNLGYFRLVLLVSDSSDNIRGWLEQIAPWIDTLDFAAVTTQMEAPVLSPYFDSGQLVGYVSSIVDGDLTTHTAFSYRAYRVGLLLMLVMLLLGMISKGEADAIRREEERAE